MTSSSSSVPTVRSRRRPARDAWGRVHAPVAGVPRWARVAALAVPLTVLPSSLWRIAGMTLHLPIVDGMSGTGAQNKGSLPSWMSLGVYVVLLSVASELLAFAAVGLVASWGEVVPRWVPVLGGRRVPTPAAVVPAAAGAIVLTLLWTWVAVSMMLGQDVRGRPLGADFPLDPTDWRGVVALVAYAPLLAWGPLLGALTLAYRRRRSHDRG